MTHLFCFAGELSADMHGGMLLQSLRKHIPNLIVTGVGGPKMRSQGLAGALSMEDFQVMGVSDIIRSYPRLRRQYYQVRDFILDTSPEIVLFIDSPFFSLRMAKELRKKRFPGKLVQYISPSVWAWGKKRIQVMAETLDLLLTIYPFEGAYFKNSSLSVKYVGNPVKESLLQHSYDPDWHKVLGIKDTQNLVALFPGSRPGEIQRNLPKQLLAAAILTKEFPEMQFGISCAQEQHIPLVRQLIDSSPLAERSTIVPRTYTYDLMKSSRSAIAKSGTITLELSLHHCPTVVMYELTFLNRLVAKHIMRLNLPHYCIVNILAGEEVFPELIVKDNSPGALASHLKVIHINGNHRNECLTKFNRINNLLGPDCASQQAAQAIMELV